MAGPICQSEPGLTETLVSTYDQLMALFGGVVHRKLILAVQERQALSPKADPAQHKSLPCCDQAVSSQAKPIEVHPNHPQHYDYYLFISYLSCFSNFELANRKASTASIPAVAKMQSILEVNCFRIAFSWYSPGLPSVEGVLVSATHQRGQATNPNASFHILVQWKEWQGTGEETWWIQMNSVRLCARNQNNTVASDFALSLKLATCGKCQILLPSKCVMVF